MGGVAQVESAASKVFESAVDVVVGPRGGLPAYAWWRFMCGYRLVNLIAVPGREHGQPRTGKTRDDGSQ